MAQTKTWQRVGLLLGILTSLLFFTGLGMFLGSVPGATSMPCTITQKNLTTETCCDYEVPCVEQPCPHKLCYPSLGFEEDGPCSCPATSTWVPCCLAFPTCDHRNLVGVFSLNIPSCNLGCPPICKPEKDVLLPPESLGNLVVEPCR
ncbi:unnamed protein product [Effrenium voratum]|nr:unnamed protein product [Effrenium voratum]